MRARLIVADDHEVVRQGLCEIIGTTPDLEILAEAADGLTAEALAKTRPAELLILDVAMPKRSGLQVLQSLRASGIALPILFFSMYPASQYASYLRRAGAQGFVGKDAGRSQILSAIRRILAGRTCFGEPKTYRTAAGPEADVLATLSRREAEVMQRLLHGVALIDIATELGVSPQTVSTYRRRVFEKLGVDSNVELAELVSRRRFSPTS